MTYTVQIQTNPSTKENEFKSCNINLAPEVKKALEELTIYYIGDITITMEAADSKKFRILSMAHKGPEDVIKTKLSSRELRINFYHTSYATEQYLTL